MENRNNRRRKRNNNRYPDRRVMVNPVDLYPSEVGKMWSRIMLGFAPSVPYWMPNADPLKTAPAGILYPTSTRVVYCTAADIEKGKFGKNADISKDWEVRLSEDVRGYVGDAIDDNEYSYMKTIVSAVNRASIVLLNNFLSDQFNDKNGLIYVVDTPYKNGLVMTEFYHAIKAWSLYTLREMKGKIMDGIYPPKYDEDGQVRTPKIGL